MSLRARTAKGFAFESIKIGITTITSTVRLMILAQLLDPNAFGSFALALALITGLETITNVNARKYLIQRKRLDPAILGSAWILGICRGALTCGATLLLAPFYGDITGQPAATEILYIVAFVSLVRGFRSPADVLAERNLSYFKLNAFEVCIDFIEALIVVSLAFLIRDAKALAWALLCSALVGVVASYFVFGFGFRFAVDRKSFRELLGVGRHFVVIGILSYAMIQGDNLMVGALLGTTMLGYYVIAYRLVDLPLRLTFQITNRVGFNALSRLQEDPKRMRDRFLELFDLQAAILFPMIAFIVIAADPLVTTLFGAKWAQSVPVVRALGLIMLGRGISLIVVPFLMASGGYSFISKVKLVETVTFFSGVIVGAKLAGLIGVAVGGGMGYAIAAAVRLQYLTNVGQIDAKQLLQHFVPVLLSLIVPITLTIVSERTFHGHPAVRLIACGCIFAVSYAAITIAGRPALILRLRETVGDFRRSVRMVPATRE